MAELTSVFSQLSFSRKKQYPHILYESAQKMDNHQVVDIKQSCFFNAFFTMAD